MPRAAVWAGVASLGGQVSTFLAAVATARILGPSQFGTAAFAIASANALSGMAAFAPVLGITRDLAARADERTVVQANTKHALALVATLAVVLVLAVWAGWFPLIASRRTLGLVIVLGTALMLLQLLLGILVGRQAFRDLTQVRTRTGVLSGVAQVCGAWWGGVTGALIGATIGTVAAVYLTWRALPPWRVASPTTTAVRLTRVDWWATVFTGALAMPVLWAAQAILAARPDGAIDVAILAALAPMGLVLQFAPVSLGQALLPAFAAAGDAHAALRRSLLFTALVTALPWAALAVTASLWFPLFGSGYAEGPTVAPILLGALAIQGAAIPLVKHLEATGRMRLNLGLNIIWAMLLLAGTWGWRADGAYAYASAALVAFAVHAAGLAWMTRRTWGA